MHLGVCVILGILSHTWAVPVVIDTDMGIDDVLAITALMHNPSINILGITVSGHGLAHPEVGARNALNLLYLASVHDIPVALGSDEPLPNKRSFPEEWRKDADSLYGVAPTLPTSPEFPSTLTAVELMTQLLLNCPHKVTILSLAPMTNIAQALIAMPSLSTSISRVVAMGGAFLAEGNVANVTEAEWNMFVDPMAVNTVVKAASVTFVPLDATNFVPITPTMLAVIKANAHSPEAQLVYQILDHVTDSFGFRGLYVWDPLAAIAMVYPCVGTSLESAVDVDDINGITRMVPSGPNPHRLHRVYLSSCSTAFLTFFVNSINRQKMGLDDIVTALAQESEATCRLSACLV